MSAQKGRAFLLKKGNGATSETFTTVAGLKSASFSLGNELVDITNKDSAGWRELLAGAGTKTVTISASGVFKNTVTEQAVQADALASSIDNYQIIFEDGAGFLGSFQIASLEYTGEHNGAREYSVTLESSGAVTVVTPS